MLRSRASESSRQWPDDPDKLPIYDLADVTEKTGSTWTLAIISLTP
jgi:hypothetical protein